MSANQSFICSEKHKTIKVITCNGTLLLVLVGVNYL